MADYQEGFEKLPEEVRAAHRALKSLMEELEATDVYHQRIAVSESESLRDVLAHNRNEEIEHASMLIEWLRRNMPGWDAALRTYLFTEGDETKLEAAASSGKPTVSLGIGALKGE